MAGLFLLAYFFYIDGVHTIIRMAVDYGLSLGFPSDSLIVALLIVQFVGFPAALVYGLVARAGGSEAGALFRGGGVRGGHGVGLLHDHGPPSSTSSRWWSAWSRAGCRRSRARSTRATCRRRRVGSFFGFFNMIGRFATIVGPVLVAGDRAPHRQLPTRDPVRDRAPRHRHGALVLRAGTRAGGDGLNIRRTGSHPVARADGGTAMNGTRRNVHGHRDDGARRRPRRMQAIGQPREALLLQRRRGAGSPRRHPAHPRGRVHRRLRRGLPRLRHGLRLVRPRLSVPEGGHRDRHVRVAARSPAEARCERRRESWRRPSSPRSTSPRRRAGWATR